MPDAQSQAVAPPRQPAKPETDYYLTSTEGATVRGHVDIGIGTYAAEVSVYRHPSDPMAVWSTLTRGGFEARLRATPAEARRIGEAWLKAAEDAEEHERLQRLEDEFLYDEQQRWDLEEDRRRDCEERGVEYSGPMAISGNDLHNLQEMSRQGHTLEPWAERLLSEVNSARALPVNYAGPQDGATTCDDDNGLWHSFWVRWNDQAKPGHWMVEFKRHAEPIAAVVDDFGDLVLLGPHAIDDPDDVRLPYLLTQLDYQQEIDLQGVTIEPLPYAVPAKPDLKQAFKDWTGSLLAKQGEVQPCAA